MTSQARHRVVFVDHVARLSGGEIALVRLVEATRGRVSAYVILGEDGPLVDRLEAAGAIVEVLPLPSRLREVRKSDVSPGRLSWTAVADLLRYIWTLQRRLRELRPHVVHTNSLKAALYGGLAAKLAAIPLVWHVRDRIAADYLPAPAVIGVRALSRWLPDRVLTNSATTLATLPLTRRSSVFYNAMNPAAHGATSGPMPSLAGTSTTVTIGMVGRIAPWKGQDIVLRAFAQAFAGGSERLHLIGGALFGEQAHEAELRWLSEDLGIDHRVSWRGFRDDMAAELAQLDILVHASVTPEPFGQVVIEGMRAGLAVIASAEGGPVEIIDNGHDGLLVPPGDVDALAAAMSRLAGDAPLRKQLGKAAQRVSQRFTDERAAAQLGDIYTSLVRGVAST